GSITLSIFRREFLVRRSLCASIASAAANLLVSVGLALAGFGYMSLVWSAIASTVATVLVAFVLRPKNLPWLPSFKGMRTVLSFGTYASSAGIINEVGQAAPELIIGRSLGIPEVAVFGKAMALIALFTRFVMRAVYTVSLPLFAQWEKSGKDPRETYFDAVSFVTVCAWPFF